MTCGECIRYTKYTLSPLRLFELKCYNTFYTSGTALTVSSAVTCRKAVTYGSYGTENIEHRELATVCSWSQSVILLCGVLNAEEGCWSTRRIISARKCWLAWNTNLMKSCFLKLWGLPTLGNMTLRDRGLEHVWDAVWADTYLVKKTAHHCEFVVPSVLFPPSVHPQNPSHISSALFPASLHLHLVPSLD